MPKLIKRALTTYIPGDPGNPGSPFVPAQPARTVVETQTVCSVGGYETQVVASGDSYAVNMVYVPPGCVTSNVTKYYPATASVAAVPSSPPTLDQLIYYLNEGWNSYASTVGALAVGGYFEYTVNPISRGVFMGLGVAEKEGSPLAAFTHGVMVSAAGIYVFENGAQGVVLASGNTPGLKLKIMRLADGRIVYSVGNVFHISAAAYSTAEPLYLYGLLYAGFDEVSSSEFKTSAQLVEPTVTMQGRGTTTLYAEATALMTGSGVMTVQPVPAVVMTGAGAMSVIGAVERTPLITMTGAGSMAATLVRADYADITLPALKMIGGDYEYSAGDVVLPGLSMAGSEAGYVPVYGDRGQMNLSFLTVWGSDYETASDNVTMSIPALAMVAGDYEYGFGNMTLPKLTMNASGDFIAADEIVLFSPLLAVGNFTPALDLILILNSAGELTSVQVMDRMHALEILSAMQSASVLDMLGVYGYTLTSDLRSLSLQTLSVNNRPDLNEGGVVWVVNTDNNASSQYEQYGFNSFFTRDGKAYGVAEDGIYLLEGDNDEGLAIKALADFGRSNYGSSQRKSVSNVYLGVGSNGGLYLKVDADEQVYAYEVRDTSKEVKNHRVDVGRGLKGNLWNMTLVNQDGADFNLESVTFTPVPLSRKI